MPENDSSPIFVQELRQFEITKSRFNNDFAVDFKLLCADEKNFFYQSYSKIVKVIKREVEDAAHPPKEPYSVSIGDFTVEQAIYSSCGETYKVPLTYQLLSNQKQPIAIVVSAFNEYQVRKVGSVLAINPRRVNSYPDSVSKPDDAEADPVQPGAPLQGRSIFTQRANCNRTTSLISC
jgi:hypothetical protein